MFSGKYYELCSQAKVTVVNETTICKRLKQRIEQSVSSLSDKTICKRLKQRIEHSVSSLSDKAKTTTLEKLEANIKSQDQNLTYIQQKDVEHEAIEVLHKRNLNVLFHWLNLFRPTSIKEFSHTMFHFNLLIGVKKFG